MLKYKNLFQFFLIILLFSCRQQANFDLSEVETTPKYNHFLISKRKTIRGKPRLCWYEVTDDKKTNFGPNVWIGSARYKKLFVYSRIYSPVTCPESTGLNLIALNQKIPCPGLNCDCAKSVIRMADEAISIPPPSCALGPYLFFEFVRSSCHQGYADEQIWEAVKDNVEREPNVVFGSAVTNSRCPDH